MTQLLNIADEICAIKTDWRKHLLNISKQNEILSSQNDMLGAFLIQATSESKFVKMTPTEIETNVPKYIDTLDKVRNSAGVTDE